jgi:hypothetical protein
MVFVVRLSRRAKVAQELLGEPFWSWLVTDRWRAYTWSPLWRRQVCWVHLLRDLAATVGRGGRSSAAGLRELKIFVELVSSLPPAHWKFRDDLFDNDELDEALPRIRHELAAAAHRDDQKSPQARFLTIVQTVYALVEDASPPPH